MKTQSEQIFPQVATRARLQDLAAFWRVKPQTVQSWRTMDAPLHSTEEMLSWLAGRQARSATLTARIAELSAGAAKAKRQAKKSAGAEDDPPPEKKAPGLQGAASALKRLAEQEVVDYEAMLVAAAEGNPQAAKQTHERWIRTTESLRKYELIIEESRRDAGELIPRAEFSRLCEGMVFWWLHSINRSHDVICDQLVGLPDGVAVWRALDAALVNAMGEAFAFAAKRQALGKKGQAVGLGLPEWAVADVLRALHVPLAEVEEKITP